MKLKRSWIPALAVALIALTTGGWLLQQGGGGDDGPFAKQKLLEQVHRIVAERYVEPVDPGELYQMAIDGMLHELGDPYSSFLDPEEVEQLELSTTGNYGGLGIRIDSQDGWITVVSVLPNTPAERQGLQSGDRIIQVESESAEGWSTTKAVNVLRGEKGSKVQITVARVGSDKPLRFSIERAEIHVEAVTAFMLDGGTVGYVKLNPFSKNARQELKTAIEDLQEQGARSLVLDLRENPGGLLDEGVAVSDLFLDEGTEVVSTKSRVESENETYTAPGPKVFDMPLAVMVNSYSASASEIVAGALQDQDRALVVGTTTFGKGSVQSLFRLPAGNYLKLTTGRWYTPSGRTIQKPHDREAQIAQQAVSMAGERVQVSLDTAEREAFRTAAGRTVYGGGGITPDLMVTPDTLSSRQQLLRSSLTEQGVALSEVAFKFAVAWSQDHPDLPRDFRVTEAMRKAFHDSLSARVESPISGELYADATEYVNWLLGQELARAAFGEPARLRRALNLDRQLDRAVALLRQAGDTRELFALAEGTSLPADSVAARAPGGS